jgi:uncharacterized membrane protein
MRRFIHPKAAWDYLRGALWVLALQIASSQFSPRLLGGFLRTGPPPPGRVGLAWAG